MPSIYALKPRFQRLLRPAVAMLAHAGVTANQVTVFACAASFAVGLLLRFGDRRWMLVLPPFLVLRMGMNAADGMLAREFGQASNVGTYLNEISDVIADACLYVPFAYLPGFSPFWILVVIVLAAISEMTGVVAVSTGASRRYDGPMGKSDRALVFGALALPIGFGIPLARWISVSVPPLLSLLLLITIVNRIRKGLAELGNNESPQKVKVKATYADCGREIL